MRLLFLAVILIVCSSAFAWHVDTEPNLKAAISVEVPHFPIFITLSDIPHHSDPIQVLQVAIDRTELGYCIIKSNADVQCQNLTVVSNDDEEITLRTQLDTTYHQRQLNIVVNGENIFSAKIYMNFNIHLEFVDLPSNNLVTNKWYGIKCRSKLPGKLVANGKALPYIYSTQDISIMQQVVNSNASSTTANIKVNEFVEKVKIFCKFGSYGEISQELLINYPPKVTGFVLSDNTKLKCSSHDATTIENGDSIRCVYNAKPLPHTIVWKTSEDVIISKNEYLTLKESQLVGCTVVNSIDGQNRQHTKWCNFQIITTEPTIADKIFTKTNLIIIGVLILLFVLCCGMPRIYNYIKAKCQRKRNDVEDEDDEEENLTDDSETGENNEAGQNNDAQQLELDMEPCGSETLAISSEPSPTEV